MPILTKEEKEKLEEKLEYINLDIENIPEFLLDYTPLEYIPSKGYDENVYKVYQYVSVKAIEILLTKANRLDYLEAKYKEAYPISSYIHPKTEEDLFRYTTFLNMLNTVQLEEIEKIEEEQKQLSKGIPFKVKYPENYLWQVYYSPVAKQYFMLVPTEDKEYATFFYLLKKQIECYQSGKDEKIFIPICHEDYSGKYLKRLELKTIENYLWLFTGEWPLVYEVRNQKENLSIQIVGEIFVYEKYKSSYKITLADKEEAIRFFKLTKALFILQTELPKEYQFQSRITKGGSIEFWFQDRTIEYEDLTEFVEFEYNKTKKRLNDTTKEIKESAELLVQTKQLALKKEQEYLEKERQIATYLACRKTFFGRVKYFFTIKKGKKGKTKLEVPKKINKKEDEKVEIQETSYLEQIEKEIKEKQFYTIEDLIKITKYYNQKVDFHTNLKLDLQAMKDKIERLEVKVKNATIYIEEIDQHNKSIFDFWRFTNKDNNLQLAAGNSEEESKNKLDKTFHYDEDLEEVGKIVDKVQRNKLSKEECDAIYIANTNVLSDLNFIKQYSTVLEVPNEIKVILEKSLQDLKKEAEVNKAFFYKEDFDIFGGISEDKTRIETLSGKKHREISKNKFKILDITKNTTVEEYMEVLLKINELIRQSINKMNTSVNLSIYITGKEILNTNALIVCNINPEKAMKKAKEKNGVYLYRFNLKEKMPVLFYTNIMYYDNYNKTLPTGMDLSDEVLLKIDEYDLEKVKQSYFRINKPIDEITYQTNRIEVVEYDLKRKEIEKEKGQND